jgi:Asp/Glu/hydantoin racemase
MLTNRGISVLLDIADGIGRPKIVSSRRAVDFAALAVEGDRELVDAKSFVDANDKINETHGAQVVLIVCASPQIAVSSDR